MEVEIHNSWKRELSEEFEKDYFKSLIQFVKSEYETRPDSIFPKEDQIFRAFDACPFDEVKVVILGQDPYPTKGHAHGLCFSVEPTIRPLPKSLNNIYKELEADLGVVPRENGDLSHWAEQGVLLLNSVLTVREGEANSHKNHGWECFTDAVIEKLAEKREGIVYILWGNKAQEKGKVVDAAKNRILTSPHPSPLSSYRGFFGSKPFSKTNDYLSTMEKKKVQW
ncbi:MAG: uracil-DNA glycosylase [Crocinitomicaceae bacterium]|nr:uracil-DNA glycosylase [Flavobacteriales bacterium]NQZ38148.1 uracil-DNA glycosylase [Crocinitomicaceae bacterium]